MYLKLGTIEACLGSCCEWVTRRGACEGVTEREGVGPKRHGRCYEHVALKVPVLVGCYVRAARLFRRAIRRAHFRKAGRNVLGLHFVLHSHRAAEFAGTSGTPQVPVKLILSAYLGIVIKNAAVNVAKNASETSRPRTIESHTVRSQND